MNKVTCPFVEEYVEHGTVAPGTGWKVIPATHCPPGPFATTEPCTWIPMFVADTSWAAKSGTGAPVT